MTDFWLGTFNGAAWATALWFMLAAWWLRRERKRRADFDNDAGKWRERFAKQTPVFKDRTSTVTKTPTPDEKPVYVPTEESRRRRGLTGIVQKELPPNRVSETWAEDQRRWQEWLRGSPDRSRP